MKIWFLSLEICHKDDLTSVLMPGSTMMRCEKKPPDQMKIAFVMVISLTLLQLQIKHSSKMRGKKKIKIQTKTDRLEIYCELGLRVPV